MPVVLIPTCFLDLSSDAPGYVECRLTARTAPTAMRELQERYPQLFNRFKRGDGVPSADWFGLFRERDGAELWEIPDEILEEDDRLTLINQIGC